MDAQAIEAEAGVLAAEIADAVGRVLDAAEAALARTADPEAQAGLVAVLEACAIGDLAGQRLARIARLARGEAAPACGLLDGPGPGRNGFDQDGVDRLLAG